MFMSELDPLCNCSANPGFLNISGRGELKKMFAAGLQGDGSVTDCLAVCGTIEYFSIPLTTLLLYVIAFFAVVVISRLFCKKKAGVMYAMLMLGGLLEVVIRLVLSQMPFYNSFKWLIDYLALIPRTLLFLAIAGYCLICWLTCEPEAEDPVKSPKKVGRPRKT